MQNHDGKAVTIKREDVVTYTTLSIHSGVHLIYIFNNGNEQSTIYLRVSIRIIEVSAEKGFVIKVKVGRSFRDPT